MKIHKCKCQRVSASTLAAITRPRCCYLHPPPKIAEKPIRANCALTGNMSLNELATCIRELVLMPLESCGKQT